MSRIQKSKRAREVERLNRWLGIHKSVGRPSHLSGWARWCRNYKHRNYHRCGDDYKKHDRLEAVS